MELMRGMESRWHMRNHGVPWDPTMHDEVDKYRDDEEQNGAWRADDQMSWLIPQVGKTTKATSSSNALRVRVMVDHADCGG